VVILVSHILPGLLIRVSSLSCFLTHSAPGLLTSSASLLDIVSPLLTSWLLQTVVSDLSVPDYFFPCPNELAMRHKLVLALAETLQSEAGDGFFPLLTLSPFFFFFFSAPFFCCCSCVVGCLPTKTSMS